MTLENSLESEITKLKNIVSKQQKDFKKTQKIFNDYKQLRTEIGKPLTDYYDEESVMKGLRGDDSLLLMKNRASAKTTIRRRHQRYW